IVLFFTSILNPRHRIHLHGPPRLPSHPRGSIQGHPARPARRRIEPRRRATRDGADHGPDAEDAFSAEAVAFSFRIVSRLTHAQWARGAGRLSDRRARRDSVRLRI